MTQDTHEQRIAALESASQANVARLAALETHSQAVYGRLGALEMHLGAIDAKCDQLLDRIHQTQLAAAKQTVCPAPGSCLELRRIVDAHEEAIEELRSEKDRRAGERAVWVAVAGVVGTVAALAVSWIKG